MKKRNEQYSYNMGGCLQPEKNNKTSYSTTNHEYYKSSLKKEKKPVIQITKETIKNQWNDIKSSLKNNNLRKLSPGEENLLLKHKINEKNTLEPDWEKDTNEHYFNAEIEHEKFKLTIAKPLMYGFVAGASAFTGIKTDNKKIATGLGIVGYTGYSIVEDWIDEKFEESKSNIAEKYQKLEKKI